MILNNINIIVSIFYLLFIQNKKYLLFYMSSIKVIDINEEAKQEEIEEAIEEAIEEVKEETKEEVNDIVNEEAKEEETTKPQTEDREPEKLKQFKE